MMANEDLKQEAPSDNVYPEPEPEVSTQTGPDIVPQKDGKLFWKLICLIVYLGMITVNALASLLPINGQDTGSVSDAYPNLFAPAGITFAIWGLIYLLLAAFIVFQFFPAKNEESAKRMQWTRVLFIISSLANIGWIFCWHYLQILASLVLMLVILASLAIIHVKLTRKKMNAGEYLLLRLPFSIYFGWITVAAVANVTTWLVSIKWDGWIFSEELWTVIILVVATIIALAVISSRGSWAYGATIVWAYSGILVKHLDPAEFGGEYLAVMITASICLGIISAASLLSLFGKKINLSG